MSRPSLLGDVTIKDLSGVYKEVLAYMKSLEMREHTPGLSPETGFTDVRSVRELGAGNGPLPPFFDSFEPGPFVDGVSLCRHLLRIR